MPDFVGTKLAIMTALWHQFIVRVETNITTELDIPLLDPRLVEGYSWTDTNYEQNIAVCIEPDSDLEQGHQAGPCGISGRSDLSATTHMDSKRGKPSSSDLSAIDTVRSDAPPEIVQERTGPFPPELDSCCTKVSLPPRSLSWGWKKSQPFSRMRMAFQSFLRCVPPLLQKVASLKEPNLTAYTTGPLTRRSRVKFSFEVAFWFPGPEQLLMPLAGERAPPRAAPPMRGVEPNPRPNPFGTCQECHPSFYVSGDAGGLGKEHCTKSARIPSDHAVRLLDALPTAAPRMRRVEQATILHDVGPEASQHTAGLQDTERATGIGALARGKLPSPTLQGTCGITDCSLSTLGSKFLPLCNIALPPPSGDNVSTPIAPSSKARSSKQRSPELHIRMGAAPYVPGLARIPRNPQTSRSAFSPHAAVDLAGDSATDDRYSSLDVLSQAVILRREADWDPPRCVRDALQRTLIPNPSGRVMITQVPELPGPQVIIQTFGNIRTHRALVLVCEACTPTHTVREYPLGMSLRAFVFGMSLERAHPWSNFVSNLLSYTCTGLCLARKPCRLMLMLCNSSLLLSRG